MNKIFQFKNEKPRNSVKDIFAGDNGISKSYNNNLSGGQKNVNTRK